jgi:sec-independent protein translocase protein TatA
MSVPLAFDFSLNPVQVIIIGVIAVMLFGKRLPEVGRSLGKHIAGFRKGIRSIEDVIHQAATSVNTDDYSHPTAQHNADDHDEATAPKFEPPPQPKRESAEVGGNGQSIADAGQVSSTPGLHSEMGG